MLTIPAAVHLRERNVRQLGRIFLWKIAFLRALLVVCAALRLTEKIDTSTAAGKLITNVFASLTEYDRNLTRERTMAGLKAGRARGRNGGRPPKIGPKELREITCCWLIRA